MLVTLAGYDILKGRRLLTETNASDFAHLIAACLFHDIGYVRGILDGDSAEMNLCIRTKPHCTITNLGERADTLQDTRAA